MDSFPTAVADLALSRALRVARPTATAVEDDAQLAVWLREHLGVPLPGRACSPQHTPPFRAFSDATFARHPLVAWHDSRGPGGKSFMPARASTWCATRTAGRRVVLHWRRLEVGVKRVALALAGAVVLVATGHRDPMHHRTVLGDGSDDQSIHIYLPHASAAIDDVHDGMELVYVPAGDFLMGSADDDPEARDNEKPQHEVYLDAYWMDKTEVTNAMFEQFVAATGHRTDAERLGTAYVFNQCGWSRVEGAHWLRPEGPGSDIAGRMDHPVVQVSWNDADAYCRWAGRRLPTEAEWEKAARGSDGRKYPWGQGPPAGDLLNFADVNLGCSWADLTQDDGYERTAPVGTYPAGASPYGALDMAGNVWEWVADWYDSGYYAVSPRRNPPGPSAGEYRALRGGSWSFPGVYVRAASRFWYTPDIRDYNNGFRCARSPSS